AGDGPQRAELEALAAKLVANVTFLGRLSGEDLSAAVTGARGAIVPSEWYENAPMSLLEAYAHGVPVIGADIGGIPELIREGETGALFPSGDADALAGAMADWMDAPRARLADMRRAARAFVEENFSKARYQQRLFEIYARLGVKVA
ncbi:MAG: glycosyltransferase family 4 protein, partial [Pseudomonadota bacterium]